MRSTSTADIYTGVALLLVTAVALIAGCPVSDANKQATTAQTSIQLPVVDNSQLITAALSDPTWPAAGTVKAYA